MKQYSFHDVTCQQMHALVNSADRSQLLLRTHFCYKKFTAIIVLEEFPHIYINAGKPGSVGGIIHILAWCKKKVAIGEWLAHSPRTIDGVSVTPYVVADSAYPLEPPCIKCHEVGQPPYRDSFNYSVIRTRR